MTRLHIQVNQTMQFYRGQQGGSAPQRLFLSGGASVMPYTAQFFAEKLNVPVEYFNPLRNIQLDPAINLEELARVAHSLGEVVGLGLRNLAHCPVELNLMPESTLRWQSFNQKKPYFIATVFSLVAVVAAMGFLFDKLAGVKTEVLKPVEEDVAREERKEVQFKKAYHEDRAKAQQEVDQLVGWMDDRYYWARVLSELRRVLIRVEQTTKTKLRTDAGVWVDQVLTAAPRTQVDATLDPSGGVMPVAPDAMGGNAAAAAAFARRYGLEGRGAMPMPQPPVAEQPPVPAAEAAVPGAMPGAEPGAVPAPGLATADTNQIGSVTITFRAVSLKGTSGQPDADKGIAYAVEHELRNSPLFESDPQQTRTTSDVSHDEQTGTFTFSVVARLKKPLKL